MEKTYLLFFVLLIMICFLLACSSNSSEKNMPSGSQLQGETYGLAGVEIIYAPPEGFTKKRSGGFKTKSGYVEFISPDHKTSIFIRIERDVDGIRKRLPENWQREIESAPKLNHVIKRELINFKGEKALMSIEFETRFTQVKETMKKRVEFYHKGFIGKLSLTGMPDDFERDLPEFDKSLDSFDIVK